MFETYAKNIKTAKVLLDADRPFAYLSLIFILILFKKKFCLLSGLTFTLIDVTSFLPDNMSGLQKVIFMLAFSNFSNIHPKICNAMFRYISTY